jgi:1,4-alpha-glucan branching enzyme
MPSMNSLVVYELHIWTFNLEGLEENHVGDFYKVEEKLYYLESLGINAIEIMPVMEFPHDC